MNIIINIIVMLALFISCIVTIAIAFIMLWNWNLEFLRYFLFSFLAWFLVSVLDNRLQKSKFY
jgi:membrane protein implicated in regulation of membrane protease activity